MRLVRTAVCAGLLAILCRAAPLLPADYCIDAASGSDAASGLCSDQAWEGFDPSTTFPFQYGDRILIGPGTYVYPRTGWYMLPGVSWIGAGRERTTIVYDKQVEVPFVRFRTGSNGSGPPFDLRPQDFGNDTVFAEMTLVNQGSATAGIDVRVSSADSSPTIRDVAVEGFPIGIELHPNSDERGAASTHAVLTRNVIRDTADTGVLFYSDVFYARLVTEASSMTNSMVSSDGAGAGIRTFISYENSYDPADALVEPVLTNNTITGGAGSGALLISYLDDGYGRWAAQEDAGTFRPILRNSILTGSARYGIEEYSAYTEPAEVSSNCLGGNDGGDYLDEGQTVTAAGAVGAGNIADAPLLVDEAAGDLHQTAGSPTVDRVTANAPADDVDRQARPQGTAADMGADEHFPCTAVADASRTRMPAPCSGGSVLLDATASIVDSACTGGLLYEWWEGSTLLATTATHPFDPAGPTTVTLRVRCADTALSACRDSTDLPIDPPSPAVLADAGPDPTLALGESVDLGGTPTASGGSPPFAYIWDPDPPELDTSTDPANPRFSPTAVGSPAFTVTVIDQALCTGQDSVTVIVVPALAADAGPDHDISEAEQAVLGGDPAAAGGEPPYTYSWGPTGGLDDPAADRPTFTPSAAGDHAFTLTVRDSRNRQASDQVVVRVSALPDLAADAGPDQAISEMEQAVLGGDPAAAGGLPPYTYAWAPTGGLDDPGADRPTFTPAATGDFTFTLTVRDARDVQATDQVTVSVAAVAVLTADAGPDRTLDVGEPARLGGTPAAAGGEPPYVYTWSPPDGLDRTDTDRPTFSSAATGQFPFTLTVEDSLHQTAQDQVTITVTDLPDLLADAGADRTVNVGEPTVLGGEPAGTGGQPPLTYAWSPPDGLDRTDLDRPTFTPTAAGRFTFTLVVEDAGGRRAQDEVAVDVEEVPALVADAGGDRTVRTGDRTVLGGSPTASGGLPPYSYSWSPDLPGFGDPAAANPGFLAGQAGVLVFEVTVTDAGQRQATDTVTVTVEDATPDDPPGEVFPIHVRNLCNTEGWLEVTFEPADRADSHRLYAGAIGDFAGHENLPFPQGCDYLAGDPDVALEFHATDPCSGGRDLYFLVVGANGNGEGSYGEDNRDGDPVTPGDPRPPGTPLCP